MFQTVVVQNAHLSLLIGLSLTSFVVPTVLVVALADWSVISRMHPVIRSFPESITAHGFLLNGVKNVSIALNTRSSSDDFNFGML